MNRNSRERKALHVQKQAFSPMKKKKIVKKKKIYDVNEMKKAIIDGQTRALAQAITLLESQRQEDQKESQILLHMLLQHMNDNKENDTSIRIGISGVPGVGKSTFIEAFGMMLCEAGYKVAVLAIDPSSTRTGGSVLGDKTRMEQLANHENAFIRPSPTSGTLGGVHRKTRESLLLCEAAGFEILLIETVGVGQSEVTVRNMVDFFMLLVLTGAGDDLQGMKKGIMEMTDLVIVHKADGKNQQEAKRTVREYKRVLHHLQPATEDWHPTAIAVSSMEKRGHASIWEMIQIFKSKTIHNGKWEERRRDQVGAWFHETLEVAIIEQFLSQTGIKERVAQLEKEVLQGEITIEHAVEELLSLRERL